MSKNNPSRRKKGGLGKTYGGKTVTPIKVIDREAGKEVMGVVYDNGEIAKQNGVPVKWSEVSGNRSA